MADSPSIGPGSGVATAGRAVSDALRAENRAAAARVRACHRLYEVCEEAHYDHLFAAGYDPEFDDRKDYAVVDPHDVASAEIVAVYGVHLHRARPMLTLARDLVLKFPAIVDAMESGRLDERSASMLVNQMRTVDARYRPEVHRAVVHWLMDAIDSGRRPGRDAMLSQTDRIIEEHDPEGVLNRRRAALSGRCVKIRRGQDGMASLHATLSAMDASAIFSALRDSVRQQIADERSARVAAVERGEPSEVDFSTEPTVGQRRADTLVDALLGPHSPIAPRGGQAAIDALIALLARSVGASISVPDPQPGSADSPHAARRLRIGTEPARRIRLRDGTCRHHHRFKTFHDWHYRLSRDGVLTVTTSTGHTVTTDPGGPLARWRQQTAEAGPSHRDNPAADAESTPGLRTRWLDPEPKPTHWLSRLRRLAAERRANTEARHAPRTAALEDDPPPF